MVRQIPPLRVNLFLEIQAIRDEAAAHVEPGHPEHGRALAEPAEDDQPTGAEQPALARPPIKQLNIVVGLSRIREYEPGDGEMFQRSADHDRCGRATRFNCGEAGIHPLL